MSRSHLRHLEQGCSEEPGRGVSSISTHVRPDLARAACELFQRTGGSPGWPRPDPSSYKPQAAPPHVCVYESWS